MQRGSGPAGRVRRTLGVLAALVVVTAALPATAAHAAGGTLTGRVTAADGSPLDRVCVAAIVPVVGGRTVAGAITDATGSYELPVESAPYWVSFADCGGRGLVKAYWRDAWGWPTATTVTVGAGQQVAGIDAALARGGTLSGTVTDTTGAGVPGVDVDIRLRSNSGHPFPQDADIRTDAAGRYVATGLPPGPYRVTFYPGGTGYAPTLYGDTADAAATPDVEVVAGETREAGATLSRRASLSGVVRDEAGEPFDRACVFAVASQAQGSLGGSDGTAADGSYTIEGLTAGTYRIRVTDCGNVTAPAWHPAAGSFDEATPVTVAEAAAVNGVDVTMARGLHVAGRVTGMDGAPLQGATVSLYDGITGNYTGRHATTDVNGRYAVPGVRATLYKVYARGGQHRDLVERWWPGVPTKAAAGVVSLVGGVSVTDADVSLPRGGRLLGTVTDPAGNPAQGACVSAWNQVTDQAAGARTDLAGNYLIRGLDAGSYLVSYTSCGAENYAPAYYGGTDDIATAEPVVVALAEDTTGIDQQLGVGGTISGTVTGTDGRPLDQICVHLTRDHRVVDLPGGFTDTAGRYRITALPPDDGIRVHFVDCFVKPGRYVDVYNDGAQTLGTAPAVAAGPGTETVVNATMARGGSFGGTVRDQFGKVLYGVCMFALDPSGASHGGTFTDQDGRYSIGGIRAGTYVAYFYGCAAHVAGNVYHPGVAQRADAVPFEVREAADTPGIDARIKVVTTPTVPLDVGVAPGDGSAVVSWQPPADDGSSAVTAFEVRDAGGDVVATTTGSARRATVAGLANGTGYAFTVNAVNAVNAKGAGDKSPPVGVVPRGPARLTLAVPAAVVSGSTATLSGSLAAPDGAPLAGAPLDLLGRRRGSAAAMTRLAGVTTTSSGAYGIAVRPAYPMEYAVRYAGSAAAGPASSVTRTLAVAPKVTVGTSGRSVSVVASPASGGGRARLQVLRSTGWVSVTGADLSATGRATLRAAGGGTYRVVVLRSGWATWTGTRFRLA